MSISPLPSRFLCGDPDAEMTRSTDIGRDVLVREYILDFPGEYLVAPIDVSITCGFYLSVGKAASPVPAILFRLYAFGRPGRISYALSSPVARIRNAEDEVVVEVTVVFTTRTWILFVGYSFGSLMEAKYCDSS